jgi:asparagine synthase (glutamine-hydrolysing)
MCGLVGFLGSRREDHLVESMLEELSHRGVDDRGVEVVQVAHHWVHLGHNRLSIQDTTRDGHQPFISSCGEYRIVFNGEVYNFKEIRQELEALGERFVSKSDTEVILYAYKVWGMGCLERFIGMFAFALLDQKGQKLYLVRDRAGVKPLYYYHDGTSFLFASEIKSLHQHPRFDKALHAEVLPYYFQMGYIPSPSTIFKHTYKLEAGHYLCYDLLDDSLEKMRYWSVDEAYAQEKFDTSEAEILEDLEALLENAVALRMVADVEVGVFLSGGYDSSLVTALLAPSHQGLETFTIGFKEKGYNEAHHAKEIASHLGVKHHLHYLHSKEIFSDLEVLPFLYDEPFGDASALAMMQLSRLASRRVQVVLSADGGDESFCGYSKYIFLQKFSSIFSHPFKKTLLKYALDTLSSSSIAIINDHLPSRYQQRNIEDKYHKFKQALHQDSFAKIFEASSSPVGREAVERVLKIPYDEAYFAIFNQINSQDLLNRMMQVDYQSFMGDDILAKVDRATMGATIEGREPLLDHRIIEYLARVPIEIKYKEQTPKYLLRQILYKRIPPHLVDRPKSGFQLPLKAWLRGELKGLVEHYLDPQRLDEAIFDRQEIKRIKERLFAGDVREVNKVWFILIFELWRERWFG